MGYQRDEVAILLDGIGTRVDRFRSQLWSQLNAAKTKGLQQISTPPRGLYRSDWLPAQRIVAEGSYSRFCEGPPWGRAAIWDCPISIGGGMKAMAV